MIESKQDLKEYLDAELGFYKANPIAAFFGASESAILRRHQRLLRKAEYHVNTGHKLRGLFFRFLLKRIQLRYSLQIPLNAFGKGLHIMHLGPILVNGRRRPANAALSTYSPPSFQSAGAARRYSATVL